MGIAALLFTIAALGGAVMAAMRLGGRELPPLWLALLHGAVAAAGLVTLLVAIKGGGVSTIVLVAAGGFFVAALGGLTMFILFHLKKRALPVPLMLGHAGVAVLSFIALLVALFVA
jgi:hypothetical protein